MDNLVELYYSTKDIYERYYDVHICLESEVQDLIAFLDNYWQKGHILTKSRELLDWQHYDKQNHRYNFVIARHLSSGEIHGVFGFIISSIYDNEIMNPIRWGAIWKVRDEVSIKGLGVFLKAYAEVNVPTKYIGGVGLSNDSKTIDKKLGERIGSLNQFYILNPQIKEYLLVDNVGLQAEPNVKCYDTRFVSLDEDSFIQSANCLVNKIPPYKSVNYYVNRFFNHPIYNYTCIKIENPICDICDIIFYRVSNAPMGKFIFVVDYIGDGGALSGTYHSFCKLLSDEKAECISFPCDGMREEYLSNAGFRKRDDMGIILPVYFEPFIKKNVDLCYHFWPSNENYLLVKGDADQDRPSMLPEEL